VFAFPSTRCAKEDIQKNYGFNGDLLNLFTNNEGPAVHKWHHYIPLYDRYFSPYRGRDIRFLEMGVGRGGSLQMWRRYFGESAAIFGVDIDPACAKHDGDLAAVRIGSQSDSSFLLSVVKEMGGVDIVVDDGSHQMRDIAASFRILFPELNCGGLYVIEDLHTAYWKRFGGGYRKRGNFFYSLMPLVEDMHHWYLGKSMLN